MRNTGKKGGDVCVCVILEKMETEECEKKEEEENQEEEEEEEERRDLPAD